MTFFYKRQCRIRTTALFNMSVTLHTNLGDIKIEVFCESVPKTAEVIKFPGTTHPVSKQSKSNVMISSELPRSLRIWILRWLSIPPTHSSLHDSNRRATIATQRRFV